MPDHSHMPGFKEFEAQGVNSIAELAEFIERFGIYRFYVRSPRKRVGGNNIHEADQGYWEAGIMLNDEFYDYKRSGPCSSLEQALSVVLGVPVTSGPAAPAAGKGEDDEGLLV